MPLFVSMPDILERERVPVSEDKNCIDIRGDSNRKLRGGNLVEVPVTS